MTKPIASLFGARAAIRVLLVAGPTDARRSPAAVLDEVRNRRISRAHACYKAGMQLDPDVCYRAIRTRDARFDGRFFTAVRTTGVYCRPICPALPKRANCIFLPCAAAAQEAGYRPCLRCRPEASPGTPAWLGTSATVSRALRLIGQGGLDGAGVDALASRLGVGERHLRRLFVKHLGAPPLAVARTRRVLFAKKLIDETDLPMAQVALSSGFSSVRRFNAAIRRAYGRSPRELRRAHGARANDLGASDLQLRLPFRAPLDWAALTRYLAPRATRGVELVTPERYQRTICIDGVRGSVEVSPGGGEGQLLARIRLAAPAPLIQIVERLRRIFDLGADPGEIAAHLECDPRLRRAVRAQPGLRIPGAWDGFELSVRAILGQQVSVRAATELASRLVEAFGEPLAGGTPDGLRFVFPCAERLADADLTAIGLTRARAGTVSALARAVARGELDLDGAAGPSDTLERLRALPGVGEWTTEYIAMRALREPDAFPAGDLGLRRACTDTTGRLPSAAELRERAEAWRPWRAYAAMLLWMAPAPGARAEARGLDRRMAAPPPARVGPGAPRPRRSGAPL